MQSARVPRVLLPPLARSVTRSQIGSVRERDESVERAKSLKARMDRVSKEFELDESEPEVKQFEQKKVQRKHFYLRHEEYGPPALVQLTANRPKIVDFTLSPIYELQIPYDPSTCKFPLCVSTGVKNAVFEFMVCFTRQATPTNFELLARGSLAMLTPPDSLQGMIRPVISIVAKTNLPCKAILSYTYSRTRENHRLPDRQLFSKENRHRIEEAYRASLIDGLGKKRRSVLNSTSTDKKFIQLNCSAVSNISLVEKERQKTQRSILRQKHSYDVRKKACDNIFTKVRDSLLSYYSHDLKLIQKDIDEQQEYNRQMRQAILGTWIILTRFVKVCEAIQTFGVEYKRHKIKNRAIKSRKQFALRMFKEFIKRNHMEKEARNQLLIYSSLKFYTDIISGNDRFSRAVKEIRRNLFNSEVAMKMQLNIAVWTKMRKRRLELTKC